MTASMAQHLPTERLRQASLLQLQITCACGEKGVYKIITSTEKRNKEQLFIISHHINKLIYPVAGLKTDKNKGNIFPHNKKLSCMTHC